MTVKLSPSGRYDALDREEFKRMIETDAFQAVMARIAAEHKRNVDLCVMDRDELVVKRAQGAAMALQCALQIPERLLKEMADAKR